MDVDVRARNLHVTPEELDHAKTRMAYALDRFEDRVTEASVELSDTNGHRGGLDKQVRLHVRLDGRDSVRAEDTDTNLLAAIDKATTRLKAGVAHHLERHSRESHRRE